MQTSNSYKERVELELLSEQFNNNSWRRSPDGGNVSTAIFLPHIDGELEKLTKIKQTGGRAVTIDLSQGTKTKLPIVYRVPAPRRHLGWPIPFPFGQNPQKGANDCAAAAANETFEGSLLTKRWKLMRLTGYKIVSILSKSHLLPKLLVAVRAPLELSETLSKCCRRMMPLRKRGALSAAFIDYFENRAFPKNGLCILGLPYQVEASLASCLRFFEFSGAMYSVPTPDLKELTAVMDGLGVFIRTKHVLRFQNAALFAQQLDFSISASVLCSSREDCWLWQQPFEALLVHKCLFFSLVQMERTINQEHHFNFLTTLQIYLLRSHGCLLFRASSSSPSSARRIWSFDKTTVFDQQIFRDGKTISQYASSFDGRVARLTIFNMAEIKSGWS
ncbi:hypothetical protein GPALN_012106 [Globodera pallida]|nr:hypothetical protein GPALN_012106 [Globodera pallida]